MKSLNSKRDYLLSFIIPVIIMIAVFAILKIYPFGEDTIMTGDTTYQLVDYLSYFKTIIFGNNDFTYSLSKNMGGEMAGFSAYYLFSPLNLLTLPFPKEMLFAGIGLIIILVPGLSSLSMCYALKHIKEDDRGVLIYSMCYGLSSYVIVYNELLYFYTNIILLPLIVLFLRKMMRSERFLSLRYVFLLSYAIINHYYTGYMICIFLMIYVIYYLLSSYESTSEKIRSFIRFAVNSILSAGLSCIVLIPAVLSLSDEKDNLSIGLFLTFPPLQYFSKLYSGSFAGDFGAGRPNIYCGVIITLLLLSVLMNKDTGKKQRILITLMLLFFWGDFCINTLNVIWHGLNQPIGFPYRQSFLVIFFCILTAYEYTDLSVPLNKYTTILMTVLFVLYSGYVFLKKIENTDVISILVTAAVIAALIMIFYLPERNRVLLLFSVTVLDLGFNAVYSVSHFYPTSIDEYLEPLMLIEESADHIKEAGDKDVYRQEKLFRRTNNDAMMLDYAGLTHFSSSEKKSTLKFLGKLGFRNNGNWAMYSGINTALSDSLLSVRFMSSQFDTTGKPYEQIYADEEGEYYIYRNNNALALMTSADKGIFDLILSEDPFRNQNDMAGAISGEKEDILYLQDAVRTDNEDGSVSFDVDIRNEGVLYCYFSAPDVQDVTLYLNGEEWTDYFRVYNWATVDLQGRKPGEKVHIDLRSNNGEQVITDNGYFAIMVNDNLVDWSRRVKSDKTEIYKITSSLYRGKYTSESGALLFTLPKDKGWQLYVDGKEYEIREACGHMMGALVPVGEHDIELKFISPGRYAGIAVSSFTFLIILVYCVLYKKKPQYFVKKIKT